MKKFYINVQGGTGLNFALASFISYIKANGDDNGNKDYEFYVCSPYFDVFEACPFVSGVYKPNELKDLILDANEYDGELVIHRLYDMDGFIKKTMNYSQAWAKLMNIPFTDTENGTKVKSILEPLRVYPSLINSIQQVKEAIATKDFDDFVIMQFTGGQSPLVQVPADKEGKPDWGKVPYDYNNEPLKRHYPIDKAQKFIDLYAQKNPRTAIIIYQLPNEPSPRNANTFNFLIPYLAYYELAKEAKEVITIDSSLQHLVAGVVPTTVIWAHSRPEHFGYSYNNNIIQEARIKDLLYFTALGPSGAKVNYIEPESLIEEI